MGAIPWNMNVLLAMSRPLSSWAVYTRRACSAWPDAGSCLVIASGGIGDSGPVN